MASGKVTRYQKFKGRRLHRSQIQNAPYNPRVIDAYAKERLRENLSDVGLLEPLIWNATTGNLVGGHQRLAILDALEGSEDYYLDVAVVKLSEAAEREENVFLNNAEVQGEWDLQALADLFRSGTDVHASGFHPLDLRDMFEESGVPADFLEDSASSAQDVLDAEPSPPRQSSPSSQAAVPPPADDAVEPPSASPPRRRTKSAAPTVTVSFGSREDREAFMALLGLSTDERYVDGKRLVFKLGLGAHVQSLRDAAR